MGWFNKNRQEGNFETNNNVEFTSSQPLVFDSTEFKPQNYEEVEAIAQQLLLRRPVKIDLTATVVAERRRIMDFLSGMIFVLDLDIDQLNNDCYELKFPIIN